jgi:hypothetical protein
MSEWNEKARDDMRGLLVEANISARGLVDLIEERLGEKTSYNVVHRKIREGTFRHSWYLMVTALIGKSTDDKNS